MTAPVALASQPGPGHDVDSRRGAAALAGGVFSLMTDAQREGRACPWCNVEVDLETGVDLGERELHRAMVGLPPGRLPHLRQPGSARRALHPPPHLHTVLLPDRCPTKLALRRLALEAR